MAASAWTLYDKAKKKLCNGTMTLPGAYRIVLVGSASNYATSALSLLGSLTDQVTEGNGYSSSGKGLSGESWGSGASTGQMKFDVTDPVWTATGGAINSIRAAVIVRSSDSAGGMHLLCYAALTTGAFNLGTGNTLTIQMNAAGVFTLT